MATFYIPSTSGWTDTGGLGEHSKMRLKVDRVYSSATNKSTLTITPQVWSDRYGGRANLYNETASFKVNGVSFYSGSSTIYATYNASNNWIDAIDGGTSRAVAWTAEVAHNSDGSATFSFAVSARWYQSSSFYPTFYGVTGSASATEPRASSVSASNGTFGSAVAITVTRAASSFTHTVTVTCLGRTETVATKTSTTSLSWTGAVATYAPLLTNAMSTTATIKCETFSGNTSVGSASITITMTLPAASVKPSTSISLSDPTGYASTYGGYVATRSKIRVALTNSLKYGATLAATAITANGQSFTSSPAVTSEVVSGRTSVTASIKDSRGQTSSTASASITILPYSAPSVASMSVRRCNQDGTANNSGAYCKVSYQLAITALNNHNSKALELKYKKRNASAYTTVTISVSSYTESSSYIFSADTDSTYDVQLIVTDDFSSTQRSTTLSTAYAFLNFGNGSTAGIGIGMVTQTSKAVEIEKSWKVKSGDADMSASFYKEFNISDSGQFPAYGYVNGDYVYLYIQPPRIVPDGWTVSCSQALSLIRTVDGGFLGGSYRADLSQYITGCYQWGSLILLELTNSGGWNITNDTPLVGRMEVTITIGVTS